ncbi:hypothetical protein ABT294_25770 [Nonomuraea sp. NPDC000554]|uniref:hypothetical protein n=1 Tax=Nonomuraea sp. NPDC000554 TaxID=3154259 RepID=UPI00332DC2D1
MGDEPTRPRKSRRRTLAAALGITPRELADDALVFRPAAEVPRPAPPQPLPNCCTVTRTKRISIGGTVMITTVHQSECVIWGNDREPISCQKV